MLLVGADVIRSRRRPPGSESGFGPLVEALAGVRIVAIAVGAALLLTFLQPARRTPATPRPVRGNALESGNGFINPALFVTQVAKDSFEIHTLFSRNPSPTHPSGAWRAFVRPLNL